MSNHDERRPAEREVNEGQQSELKRHLDKLLDEALLETFPASDPIAVSPPRKRASPASGHRPAR